jgi:glycosyltransferase involved in cell wall biosynthesis
LALAAVTWRALWRLPAPARRATVEPALRPRQRRILWIHQNFVTAREPGNSRPVGIISGLLAEGWQVDVVTSQVTYLGDAPRGLCPDIVVECDGGLTIHRLPAAKYGCDSRSRLRTYRDFISQSVRYATRLERASAVYFTSPPLPQVIPNILAALRFRCPMIVEIRDIWPGVLVDGGLLRSRLIVAAMEWIEAFAYRVAEAVIVVAPAVRPYMRAMGVCEARIHLVPSGAARLWNPDDATRGASWRHEAGCDGRFVLLYAGSFQEMNDIATLLDAAALSEKSHPELIWVFAGNGSARSRLEEKARGLSNVRDLGSLAKDDLLPRLFAADAGLIAYAPGWTMLEITIPGKLFDIMAAGRPVLFAGSGQVEVILEATHAGLCVRAGDAQALVAAACQLQHLSHQERLEMGERGRVWVSRYGRATVAGARVARIATEASRGAPVSVRRAARAGFGALGDVIGRRAQRAIQALYGIERPKTIRSTFTEWLAHEPGVVAEPQTSHLLSRCRGSSELHVGARSSDDREPAALPL